MSGQNTGQDPSESDSGQIDEPGPLEGVTVLDLTQALAGPFGTMLLADLGADVIKIEPPAGDGTRASHPHLKDDEAYGGYFHSVNRNKRSIVVDLKSEDGKSAFERMVTHADVVMENYRSGTMDRLGLSYEHLREIKPDLVYASVRGFGDPRTGESPYAYRPAYDIIAQAMGGLMSINGTEESGPTKVGPGVGDIFPGSLCALGVVSALRYRDQTGEGQYVDVSMVDGVLSLVERLVHRYSFTGEIPKPAGSTHPLFFPFDRFETSDGYVVIAASGEKHWQALCEHMDRPELIEDYTDREARNADRDVLRKEINEWTRGYTKQELFDLLADDLPCAPVNNASDIFEEEHFSARNMLVEVEHADTGQSVKLAGSPIKFSETPSGIRREAPFLGEHTEDVLADLGFDADEIDDLLAAEAVDAYRPDDSDRA